MIMDKLITPDDITTGATACVKCGTPFNSEEWTHLNTREAEGKIESEMTFQCPTENCDGKITIIK